VGAKVVGARPKLDVFLNAGVMPADKASTVAHFTMYGPLVSDEVIVRGESVGVSAAILV
jgi:hypothetical protein